jgi:hypothetical protein
MLHLSRERSPHKTPVIKLLRTNSHRNHQGRRAIKLTVLSRYRNHQYRKR